MVTGKPIHLGGRSHDWGRLIMCLLQALVGPMAAAGGVGVLCKFAGLDGHSAFFWLAVSPLIYLLWLFLLLVFYVMETSLLGLFYQKPRRYDETQDRSRVPFAITLMLYGHGSILASLPLVASLFRAPPFSRLILRAYSTRVFLGRGAWLAGEILDPDLTIIGPDVVIGEGCRIVAHSVIRTPEGSVLFQSAPIELGAACIISGGTQIELGVKVGAGSLVEPRSHIPPFTRIPPGEVWGGSPAVFRRKREFTPAYSSPEATTGVAKTPAAATGAEELRRVIAGALGISAANITADTRPENCLAWDSIGKMAIGAALHDRFGLNLPPEMVFKLDSVAAVEKAIAGDAAGEIQAGAGPLPANVELLPLWDPALALPALAQGTRELSGAAQTITVVIAATFVAQPLASALQLYCLAFGLKADVVFFDFNQVPQALLSPESPMRKNREGLNVVLLRPEDLPGKDGGERRAVAGQILDAVGNFAATSGCPLLVGDLPPVISPERRELEAEMAEWQISWRRQLASIAGVEILDFAEIIGELGKAAARDARMEREASAPFSPPVYQRLGIGVARALRKSRVPPKKVLALDCDNTLWGGVVGEDGRDGIRLGGDAAGRGFEALQSRIRALKQRGILLALVSKNLADDVWDVIENHPRMILRRNDFAAARINWQPKSENLRALAEELNVGLDSIVLLDDNPRERLEVEANCPTVTVVPLPPQTERYAEILSRLWCFDGAGETREDQKRNDYAFQETQRREFQQSTSLASYLASLELKTVMRAATEQELPRVSQLLQKTNQFNLSLKRRTLPETRALLPAHEIWVMSASDRFGDYGLVGVGIARREGESLYLDSFLMSCRALGRGIEEAFLHGIAHKARLAGIKRLRGEFVTGARNQPMQHFLQKNGFIRGTDGIYELDLQRFPAAPAHLNLEIG